MRCLILILLLTVASFSQTPPIEPGVSQELARWRAAHYSDVRYKLNLTLEKMSTVLKGTMEIRVNVRRGDGETRGRGDVRYGHVEQMTQDGNGGARRVAVSLPSLCRTNT